MSPTQGLVLAGGCGTRMGGIGDELPKCLLEVGGSLLIDHQLRALAEMGIDDTLVVVGHHGSRVDSIVAGRARTVLNPDYRSTDSLRSFQIAQEALNGPLLLVNGDVLFSPEILRGLLAAGPDHLAYDSDSRCGDEQTKVHLKGDRLLAASKQLPGELASGESIGMLFLDTHTARAMCHNAAEILARDPRASLPDALVGLNLCVFDIAGLPWIEIDTPSDLDAARDRTWPAIARHARVADHRPRPYIGPDRE